MLSRPSYPFYIVGGKVEPELAEAAEYRCEVANSFA